jgi:hypothetical protein
MVNSQRIVFFLIISAICIGGFKAYIDHRIRLEMDNLKKSVSNQMLIEYTTANSSFLGEVVVDDIKLTPLNSTSIFIDKIIIHKAYLYYDPHKLPQKIQITVNGIRIPIRESPSPISMLMLAFGYSQYYLSPSELQRLGYSDFTADLSVQAELKEKTLKALALFAGQTWGNLKIVLDLQNVTNTTDIPVAMAQASLENFSLTYTDSGLVNRLLTHLSERNAMQLVDFKRAMMKKIEKDIHRVGLNLEDSVFLNLQEFIQKPAALNLYLKPSSPVALNRILDSSPQQMGFGVNYLPSLKE